MKFLNFKIKGKIIGFILGAISSGSLFGALLASLFAHFLFDTDEDIYEDSIDLMNEQIYPDTTNVLNSILNIAVQILNTNNNIKLEDVELIKDFFLNQFKFDINEINLVDSILSSIIKDDTSPPQSDSIHSINHYCNYKEKLNVIQLMFVISQNEKGKTEKAENYIHTTADKLKILQKDYTIIKNHFIDPSIEYYKTLEVAPDAENEAIVKAYRRLVSLYHPDKNNGEGDKKKFQEVVSAYKKIKKIRKF